MKRKTKGEIVFDVFNNILMFLVILIMLYPFLNQIAISLSDNVSVMSGRVSVYPVGFTIKAYKDVMTDARFIQSWMQAGIIINMNEFYQKYEEQIEGWSPFEENCIDDTGWKVVNKYP